MQDVACPAITQIHATAQDGDLAYVFGNLTLRDLALNLLQKMTDIQVLTSEFWETSVICEQMRRGGRRWDGSGRRVRV